MFNITTDGETLEQSFLLSKGSKIFGETIKRVWLRGESNTLLYVTDNHYYNARVIDDYIKRGIVEDYHIS